MCGGTAELTAVALGCGQFVAKRSPDQADRRNDIAGEFADISVHGHRHLASPGGCVAWSKIVPVTGCQTFLTH
jgi:hypothetical protein